MFLVNCVYQVTLAPLKDKPAQDPPSTSSSMSVSSGVRSAAARFLGGGNGSRALSFVGGNGGSKLGSVSSRVGSMGASSSTSLMGISNFDGKGTYLVFNVGDAIFISDSNSQDKVVWCLCCIPPPGAQNWLFVILHSILRTWLFNAGSYKVHQF